MTTYARVQTIVQEATVSDYSDAQSESYEDEWSSVRVQRVTLSLASATARTLDLADFTAVKSILVHNNSTSYEVVAEWQSKVYTKSNPGGGGLVIVAGAPGTITDSASTGDMVTKGAMVGGYVLCASSEDAGNNGYHPITIVDSENKITTSDALTANAADTAMTLTFYNRNRQLIPVSNSLLIEGNVYYGADVVLTAVGGTAEVEVTIIGS